MLYPAIPDPAFNCNITVLGVWLTGVIVIAPDPDCPATGTTVTPLCGPKVKSGIFTLTNKLPEEADS
jgi:hypothetical protein